jgi:hypothetical protein
VCEDGLFIPGFVVHHAHGEKMERVKVILKCCKLAGIIKIYLDF